VNGAEVLDVFCYTGSFSLHALKYGAERVIAVDSSEIALEIAKENARLNGFIDKIEFIKENAFDLLRNFHKEGRNFDVVILDPPAFAKSQKNLDNALRGYKEINLRAMKIIRDGGFLVTCSCSQHVTPEIFQKVIESASYDANRILRLIEFRYQAKDHPILFSHPESLYLKCGIYQVLKKL
jgi:23S rRNA (cytosine1962-C5)-methyltransferase